jgi:hypothetical protein
MLISGSREAGERRSILLFNGEGPDSCTIGSLAEFFALINTEDSSISV